MTAPAAPAGAPAAPAAAPPPGEVLSLRPLLEEMIARDASDLHLSVGDCPKLRIDGHIVRSQVTQLLAPRDTLQLAYSVLTETQKKRFELEDELDFSFGIANLSRFRGNVFKQRGCVSMVIRQIPFKVRSFEELSLPPVVAGFADRPRGLVLVTGPTGSGKSTTLAAMIDKINTERDGHIITVEDPIEFIHKHRNCIINQREVGADTRSFASALKYALREDPDVILIGEMRDMETVSAALTIAETGHLVFATLHTNSAAGIGDAPAGHGHGSVQLRGRAAGHPGAAAGQAAVRQVQAPARRFARRDRRAAGRVRRRAARHAALGHRPRGRDGGPARGMEIVVRE